MFFQQLQDGSRMLERKIVRDVGWQYRRCGWGGRVARSGFARHCATLSCGNTAALLVIPGGPIVTLGGFVEPRVQSVLRQLEAFLYQKSCVGVIDQVILGDAVVLQRVVDQTAQEGDVGAGPNLQEEIRGGCGARESRINHDQLGVAFSFGFDYPLEAAWVVLGWIPTHDQHHVGVLDVDPAIGHRPASECRSQT